MVSTQIYFCFCKCYFSATEIKSSHSFKKVMASNVGPERCKLGKYHQLSFEE